LAITRVKGKQVKPPYNRSMVLKMLLFSYLWNVSERMIAVLSNDSLSITLFPGLGTDEKASDHATLTSLKNRLVKNGGLKAYIAALVFILYIVFWLIQ